MKVRKIIKLCKDRRQVQTVMHEGTQWIGNGSSLYPLYRAPLFGKEELCYAYDINEKQSSEMMYRELQEIEGFSLKDYEETETEAQGLPIAINKMGYTLLPFKTEEGIYFVDRKYLEPFGDEDEVRLYKRNRPDGAVYFVAKAGFVILGIIMPVDIIKDDFVAEMKSLYSECEMALKNKKVERYGKIPQESLFEEDLI